MNYTTKYAPTQFDTQTTVIIDYIDKTVGTT